MQVPVSVQEDKRDIIVHPRFWHTVLTLPVTQAPKPPTRWDELPLAALYNIASHCQTAQELCIFGRICKTARTAADDDLLWRKLCCAKFNSSPSQKTDKASWQALYRFNHRVLYDVLMCRRPDKILDLGQGAIVINLGAAAA
ncbi:hypothetical protein WJX74_005842 [Apatococcus lobatus]|uniref:F-box domain-containing protein n=2 Tax=Apatococcus TaxID=904362 RepID=A0AAW1SQL8_9CHLO